MIEANVDLALNVCTTMEESSSVLQVAKDYSFLFASVGVHPDSINVSEPSVEDLINKSNHKKIVAIGETGLDYYRIKGNADWQRKRFRTHIRAAKACKKPLIIHTRNAPEDTVRILKEEKADEVGGVLHCFTESLEMAKIAIDLNFLISLSGIVTFKNAKQVHEVAREISLKHLMIETDSPYLAPVPFRGKTNEPSFVVHVANKIAELKNESLEEVARITRRNFISFIKRDFEIT
jgi:TatD DNase family protein